MGPFRCRGIKVVERVLRGREGRVRMCICDGVTRESQEGFCSHLVCTFYTWFVMLLLKSRAEGDANVELVLVLHAEITLQNTEGTPTSHAYARASLSTELSHSHSQISTPPSISTSRTFQCAFYCVAKQQ